MSEDTNPSGSATATSEPSGSLDPVAMIENQLGREAEPPAPTTLADDDDDLTEAAPEISDDDLGDPEGDPLPEGEHDDDADPEPTAEAARTWTVKIDGKPVQVTEADLLAGYQRHADYTRKTTEVAEQRRQIEAEAARVANERAYYQQQLAQFANTFQIPPEPDPRMAETNPIAYVQQRAQWEQSVRQYQAVQAEQQRLAQQTQAEQAQHYERHLKSEMERLQEAVPDWRDPKKAAAEKRSLTEYLRKAGYTDDEIGAATDHRAIILARKAALYDKMMANKPSVDQRLQQAPKTLRPGSTDPGESVAARRKAQWKQLQRTGGVDAAAALIAMG